MPNLNRPIILSVDDDPSMQQLIDRFLRESGCKLITAGSGMQAIAAAGKERPNLILLDVMMSGMNGYEVASKLQADSKTSYIPIVFVTALDGEQDKARAFAAGAVDYLVKPISKESLLAQINTHLETDQKWTQIYQGTVAYVRKPKTDDFTRFKIYLFDSLHLDADTRNRYSSLKPDDLYAIASDIGIDSYRMSKYIAEGLNLKYASHIEPDDIILGVLPTPFCKKNNIVAVTDAGKRKAFVLSNPFNWELLETLKKLNGGAITANMIITAPENIRMFFETEETGEPVTVKEDAITDLQLSEAETRKKPVIYITNNILDKGVKQRASDIHIEPKKDKVDIRFRIDGEMTDAFSLQPKTGIQVISRIKVLAGLDISEKRKPQDGAFMADINSRTFNLRVASTSTPYGESLIIRMLEPNAKPKKLQDLGMTAGQEAAMINMIGQHSGLILIVGGTGSGKSTTIYSLLHQADCITRSLISVEDPVEYRIPFANQQQVNEKAGITFDALLKSAVRQDPDILFMGEIRDPYSAKISMDFASTGHLTISTLHTSNATTAIFRLGRLGIDRGTMAHSMLGVVAQKLLKKLCRHCKAIGPISEEEKNMLMPFTKDIPEEVARPVGCPKCNDTGYYGRDGVYEVIEFNDEISHMVQSDMPVAEIRTWFQEQGGFLISHHAIQKVRDLIFSPEDVYGNVLAEERQAASPPPVMKIAEPERKIIPKIETPADTPHKRASILVVDDDNGIQYLLSLILTDQGYKVTVAKDGIDAILNLDRERFDLILSDINMPNLDGFKLLEMMNQKGINVPVIFLTARDDAEDEIKGLELGAIDYILKPFQKKKIQLKIKGVLDRLNRNK